MPPVRWGRLCEQGVACHAVAGAAIGLDHGPTADHPRGRTRAHNVAAQIVSVSGVIAVCVFVGMVAGLGWPFSFLLAAYFGAKSS